VIRATRARARARISRRSRGRAGGRASARVDAARDANRRFFVDAPRGEKAGPRSREGRMAGEKRCARR